MNTNLFDVACDALVQAMREAPAHLCCDAKLDSDDLATMRNRDTYSDFMDDLRDRVGIDTDRARYLLAQHHGDRTRFIVVSNSHKYLTAHAPGQLSLTTSYANAYTFADCVAARGMIEHAQHIIGEPLRVVMVTVPSPTRYGGRITAERFKR